MKYLKILSVIVLYACLSLELSYRSSAEPSSTEPSSDLTQPVVNGGADYSTASPEAKKQIIDNVKRLREAEAFKLSELQRTQDASRSLLAQDKDISDQESYLKELLELSASFPGKLVAQSATAYTNFAIANLAQQLSGTPIEPGKAFSLLGALKEKKLNSINDDALNVMATGIYSAMLKSNFEILERSTSRELPAYASIGFEARVAEDEADLLVVNPNKTPYILFLDYYNGVLYVYIVGDSLENTYHIVKEGTKVIPPRTILHHSSGGVMVGKPGAYVQIYREEFNAKNKMIKREFISEDYYTPIHQIKQGSSTNISPVGKSP
jgi:vancomycin resistance protein YoaR